MWQAKIEILEVGRTRKFLIREQGQPLSYGQAIKHWQQDVDFCRFFSDQLAAAPFAAYFWETPPITTATVEQPFEFVLVDSPALADVQPDPNDFQPHFAAVAASEPVVAFANLSGDAFLIAPCSWAPASVYPHLAAFVRLAPALQQQALWRAVGAAVEQRLGSRPLWLSTSGLGVNWLHVRLDTHPKYYTFAPYRKVE